MALQNIFEMLSFTFTVVFSEPDEFEYPVFISVGAISVAACLFAQYVRRERGHLIHLSPCIKGDEGYQEVEQVEMS